ncbi:MAG: methyltransferase domain-containing protein [Usitatibacter sp.]
MLAFVRRLIGRSEREAPVAEPAPALDVDSFRCNVCGHRNDAVPRHEVRNREFQSCRSCRSSLRMRAIMSALSLALFGRRIAVPDFPTDKSIRGLGISDWEGYANALAAKFSYTNTFFDREPRLDITRIDDRERNRYRFVICTDVFEHIPLFALDEAFRNLRALLAPGGVCIFTVPYFHIPSTVEHFPELSDFRIVEADGRRVLLNTTRDGREQVFTDLVFHGGEGATLEMRVFNKEDVLTRLRDAGFSSVVIDAEDHAPYGILWPIDWALPIIARA